MNAQAPIVPTTASVSSNILASRAMIVSLTISQWSGRRLDREVTDETNKTHAASADAGRFNKLLLPAEALAPITKIVSEARTQFATRTLPWVDTGGRIMSNHAHPDFVAWFGRMNADFERAVAEFIAAYPTHKAATKARLGSMFKDADYPTADELRDKFKMRISIMPVPTGDDFRVAMSEVQAAEIRADIERNIAEAQANATRDIYRRVRDVASAMVDRMSAFKPATRKGERSEGIFRDTLVGNVRDLIAILPSLNVTGAAEITALGDRLQALAAVDADALRADAGKRQDAAAAAQKILDDIGGFLA